MSPAKTFPEWWDTTKAAATPDTYRGWEESCRQAFEAGRAVERDEFRQMLRDELNGAKQQARENGGNPRYDYYADAIEMILGNLE